MNNIYGLWPDSDTTLFDKVTCWLYMKDTRINKDVNEWPTERYRNITRQMHLLGTAERLTFDLRNVVYFKEI